MDLPDCTNRKPLIANILEHLDGHSSASFGVLGPPYNSIGALCNFLQLNILLVEGVILIGILIGGIHE